jgi:hypothetical protein
MKVEVKTSDQEAGPGTSTIAVGEYHPAADEAMRYMRRWLAGDFSNVVRTQEAFASTALSGNRLSEICLGTLHRLMNGEMVSDRYLLGLAWTIRNLEDKHARSAKKAVK